MSSESKKLKLIWDFRGPDSMQIAKHHEIHLKDFIRKHELQNELTGTESLGELHSIAYLIVSEEEMIPVRDALKPNRGQYYNP